MPYPLGHRAGRDYTLTSSAFYNRYVTALSQLQEVLKRSGLKLDGVIEFNVDDELLVKRITGR